ncbi:MAG: hypothetical protein JOY70_05075 [Acidisphaera sp.]|nr:hypothetical protein [Acidisphaera sp.]
MPVLKPNEAMITEAVEAAGENGRVGLLASFAPTLQSMPAEFAAAASHVAVTPCLADGALAALDRGDATGHDAAAASAATKLASCDVVALAQFSLARAADAVHRATGRPVLTTPDSAVRRLQALLCAA